MSFKKQFLQHLFISGGFQYTTQAVLFLSTIITSRLLPPEVFGLVGLVAVFTGFIAVFLDSGISLAIIRSDHGRRFHRAADALSLLVGVLLFVVTCLLAYPLARFYHQPVLVAPTIVLAFMFIPRSLALVRCALLSKSLRFTELGKVTLVSSIVQLVLTIVFAWLHFSYWALVLPQVFCSMLVVFFYEQQTKLGFHYSSWRHIIIAYRLIRITIKNVLGFNLINYWARNIDNLLVGKLFGAASLGFYNRAYNLLTMPLSIIAGLVSTVLFPSLKLLKKNGGNVHVEYLFVLKIIALVALPVTLLLVVYPGEIVMILWGPKWIKVAAMLPYFGLLVLTQSLLSTTGNFLVLIEKEAVMRISGWVSALATLSGIVYGATNSLEAIAKFYSLTFIAVVLPFNLVYLFIYAMRFEIRSMLAFWLPLIAGSLMVWVGSAQSQSLPKAGGLLLMCLSVLWNLRKEWAMYGWRMAYRQRAKFLQYRNKFFYP